MLASTQAAYEKALAAKSVRKNDRSFENQLLTDLRTEMIYWQTQVAEEEAKASGSSSRKPIQVII